MSLSDISDVYNVSTGQDPNEFIIRRIRHGVTLYFSSPLRDTIVKVSRPTLLPFKLTPELKCIRTAKGAMTHVNFIGHERYSRLSNFTATLLHIGFVNCVYEDDDLRNAGFELISSICNYLDYAGPSLAPLKGVLLRVHHPAKSDNFSRCLLSSANKFPCESIERPPCCPCATVEP
jgi:hypothetical protein